MKVILKKSVKGLGDRGELKDVAEGYGRNFLLPQGLAMLATADNIAVVEKQRQQKEKQSTLELKEAESLANRLDGLEIETSAKVAEGGTLYAAVTAKKICDILKKKKYTITPKQINLSEPIKETGEHEVTVELPHGLEAKVRLLVKAE